MNKSEDAYKNFRGILDKQHFGEAKTQFVRETPADAEEASKLFRQNLEKTFDPAKSYFILKDPESGGYIVHYGTREIREAVAWIEFPVRNTDTTNPEALQQAQDENRRQKLFIDHYADRLNDSFPSRYNHHYFQTKTDFDTRPGFCRHTAKRKDTNGDYIPFAVVSCKKDGPERYGWPLNNALIDLTYTLDLLLPSFAQPRVAGSKPGELNL